MSAGILTAIITACILFVMGLSALLYWYAFRFEPANFKVSNIEINLVKSIFTASGDIVNGACAGEGERVGTRAGAEAAPPFKSPANNYMDSKSGFTINSSDSNPGFTILHLSDFHLRKDRKGEKLFNFVRSLSSYNPDFIFITGDLVEKDIYSDYLVEMLEGLSARAGKYAVFGVHDYYSKTPREFMENMIKRKKEYKSRNDVAQLIEKLAKIGIKVLRNERVSHTINGGLSIQIVGLEDTIIEKTDIGKAFWGSKEENNAEEAGCVFENDKKELRYEAESNKEKSSEPAWSADLTEHSTIEPFTNDLFVPDKRNFHQLNNDKMIQICLTHTPDMALFGQLVKNGVDVVLAGHTHGGQVRLPWIGAIISGCDIKAKYASGLFYFKKIVLYVSRGLGEGRYSPFRFYCQPEATLIRINF